MALTDQQIAAITTEGRGLIVEAGAGTGKTHVLVERFLHLLSKHPDWPLDGILAITFTEKATREMRTRLRRAIESRAAEPAESADLQSPWPRHRRDLDRLQVYTIHGLCARLLRENAIAAGIDPRFAVLDEQAAGVLKEQAVRQALADLAGEESPALALLAGLRVGELKEELAGLLGKRGAVQRAFDGLQGTEALLERWRAGAAEMLQTAWDDQLREKPGIPDALAGLAMVEITHPEDGLAPSVRAAQEGCVLLKRGDLAGAAERFSLVKLTSGRGDNWGGKESLGELKAELKLVREALVKGLLDRGYTVSVGPLDEAAAGALAQWQALWERTAATYDALKTAQNVLDFDDLELQAERLLYREPHDERLRGYLAGIRHLMVDEFQDTNEIQQRIVYALAHPADGGRLFAVGDAKQSIYRFRQAQVSVFYRTARDIKRYTGHGPLPLARSFRTHAGLIAALNDAFDALFQPVGSAHEDYEARPGPLAAERDAPPPLPAVPAPVELWLLTGQRTAEDARLEEAGLLAERLLALQRERFPVWDKQKRCYRTFRFADAAILFRSTTDFPLYEEQFKAAGLPYLTVSGRGYYDLPEVRCLVALLSCLYAANDDLSLATVLRSPLFSLSDETLYGLRWRGPDGQPATEPVPFASALAALPPGDHACKQARKQDDEVAFAAQTMAELWRMAGRVDVWQLLRAACDRTGYEAALALADRRTGGRQRNNAAKFLELARRYGSASLSGFLRQVQDLREREAREGEALAAAPETGAVQLMSVHAAKGLEFPVVAVADLGRGPGGGPSTPRLLHDPTFGLACQLRDENGDWQKPAGFRWAEWLGDRLNAAESKRVLYVACTRAADLLLLSGKPGETGCWMDSLLAAWSLPVDGPADDSVARHGYNLQVHRVAPASSAARASRPASLMESEGETTAPSTPLHRGEIETTSPPSRLPEREEEATAPPTCLPPGERNSALPEGGDSRGRVFAAPVPPVPGRRPISVTRLLAILAEERENDGELLTVRPAVRRGGPDTDPGVTIRAPGYVIGRITHRALADWLCLDWPEERLASRLAAWARGEGIVTPEATGYATRKASRVLAAFRRSPLHAEICAARRRAVEVPFTLDTPAGVVDGTIDLLYEDAGGWHLLDWKTEPVRDGDYEARAREHYAQLALYAEAARRFLGVRPSAAICFLGAAGTTICLCPPSDLDKAWEGIWTSDAIGAGF